VTTVRFHDPEVRISVVLANALAGVRDPVVTLRELFAMLGEQGLLVFCGVLSAPFLLPVAVPAMSTVLGAPMLLIAAAVMLSRVPWLPARLLDRELKSGTVRTVLARVRGWALRFEHLVRPRLLALSNGPVINFVNGGLLMLAVGLLMAPLPLIPFANTVPAIAILLMCFGMAERDGILIALGWFMTLLSVAYVGGLVVLVFYVGLNHEKAFDLIRGWFGSA
jgi:hypothetical protein